MTTAFYTKRGRLTRYSFACGYIEVRCNNGTRTELSAAPSLVCYHIRSSGPNVEPYPIGSHRTAWDVADTLTEARKIYAQHIRRYHK